MLLVGRLRNVWRRTQSSLWFVPSVLVVLAIILSAGMPRVDAGIADNLGRHRQWIFFGSADAARSILSAIAGSMITVISLLFSITILTLQQASTQYTPRVVRIFIRDRPSQLVLGVYLATFLYALLVLRQVRGSAIGDASVPTLSVTLAIALTVVCIGALVYFIHHVATFLQATTIIERVHHELLAGIGSIYPQTIGEPAGADVTAEQFRARQPGPSQTVRAEQAGFLGALDVGVLTHVLPDEGWIIVPACVGDYVLHGTPLAEVGGLSDADEQHQRVRNAFVLDGDRSLSQDELFGVRQLVDIALKALSPAINDQTTAEHAISCLGDVLIQISVDTLPTRVRRIERDAPDKRLELWLNRPDYAEMVAAAFSQIRRAARANVHVTQYLIEVLGALSRQCDAAWLPAVRNELEHVGRQIEHEDFESGDRELLRASITEAFQAAPVTRSHDA